jgi:glutaminyl-peptide cyclotransferase
MDEQPRTTRPFPLRAAFFGAAAVGCLIAIGVVVFFHSLYSNAEGASRFTLSEIPFNGARAYDYLKQICAIGPRRSGSPGMLAEQKLLEEHFRKLGAQIEWQRFHAPDPRNGSPVPMANLIVHWHPQSKERVLLCTHYDTLPLPMMDRLHPQGKFIGANDCASGVALLMQLGNEMANLKTVYGVDFAFLDGEEYIFTKDDPYFWGSRYFAEDYAKHPPAFRYRWGVLLDMVGQRDLQLYQERNSTSWADSRPLVEQIWATAHRLGVTEFVAKKKDEVLDDHVQLHDAGGIPACDIIDFDYKPWHTEGDTPDKCSALSLAKVGWVLCEWLTTAGSAGEGSK